VSFAQIWRNFLTKILIYFTEYSYYYKFNFFPLLQIFFKYIVEYLTTSWRTHVIIILPIYCTSTCLHCSV
jgi:hypothetical protein